MPILGALCHPAVVDIAVVITPLAGRRGDHERPSPLDLLQPELRASDNGADVA